MYGHSYVRAWINHGFHQRSTSAKAGTYVWPFIYQSVDRASFRSAQHFCEARNICMAIHMSERGSSTVPINAARLPRLEHMYGHSYVKAWIEHGSDQRSISAKAGTYVWPFICQSVDRARIRSTQPVWQARNICMAIHMSERGSSTVPINAARLPRLEHMYGHSYVKAWIEHGSDQRSISAKAGTYVWPFICQSVDRARIRSMQHVWAKAGTYVWPFMDQSVE